MAWQQNYRSKLLYCDLVFQGGNQSINGPRSGVSGDSEGNTSQGSESASTVSAMEFTAKTHELQTIIEKQTAELSQWQRRVSDLNNRIGELDDNMSRVQKEYSKSQDQCLKLQRDLRENVAQKEDQEERIATLEKRYLNAQRESTSLHDLNEKLEQELRHKEAQLKVIHVFCIESNLYLTIDNFPMPLAARREDFGNPGEAGVDGTKAGSIFEVTGNGRAIEGTYGGAEPGRKSGRRGRRCFLSKHRLLHNIYK